MVVLQFAALSLVFIGSVSAKSVSEINGQCNGIVVGNVTNYELKELSGLAESHGFPDVFYSIQDSGNNPSVYVINKNGTLRGEIKLDQIRNNDFEDIAVTSGDEGNYIYVGDIGNNWGGHCMGYDQSNRMIHIFKEPDLEEYQRNEGVITMPTSNITTLLLTDDELDCTESAKEDTEAMFIDSISNTGYIIQKVRERNTNKSSVIFKFDATIPSSTMLGPIRSGYKNQMVIGTEIELKRVGNIPPSANSDQMTEENLLTFITGGDISTDGTKVFLRNSNRVLVWNRDVNGGESVEEALMKNQPNEIPLCYVAGNGESIALKHDGTGFITVSEAEDEADAQTINVPIFFYPLERE